MGQVLAIMIAAALTIGGVCLPRTSAEAAPNCAALADAMKSAEAGLAEAFDQKASGEEHVAMQTLLGVTATLRTSNYNLPEVARCMNDAGRMHLLTLFSKIERLDSELRTNSTDVYRDVQGERGFISTAKHFRDGNAVYSSAMNEDLAAIIKRYNALASVEASARRAKNDERAKYLEGRDAAITTLGRSTPRPRLAPRTVRAPGCARPNVDAETLHAVEPDTPPTARQQGISGTVQVIVSLDEQSRVTAARIQSSPSAILNDAALAAARASVFRTQVRNCKPIAADFVFSVEFNSQ